MPRRHEPAGRAVPERVGTAAGNRRLRGLVGAGPSQVGIVGALRARDVSRPTADDVVRALAKPEPTARPTIHASRQDAATQEAARQEQRQEQPSGSSASGSGRVGQRRRNVGFLVAGDLREPAHVPLLAGKVGSQEQLDEPGRFPDRVLPRADADHVCVVVLPGKCRGVVVPGERRSDALDLVGGNRLAVAGAPDDDAQAASIGGRGDRGGDDVGRVVVVGDVASADRSRPARGRCP